MAIDLGRFDIHEMLRAQFSDCFDFRQKAPALSTEPVLAQRQEKGLGMEIIPCPIHTKIPFTLYQYSNPFSSVFHDYSISTNHHYYNSSGIISLVMWMKESH